MMKNQQKAKTLRIKKDVVVNVVTDDGRTVSGKIKNFSRHSSGAVYFELEKAGEK